VDVVHEHAQVGRTGRPGGRRCRAREQDPQRRRRGNGVPVSMNGGYLTSDRFDLRLSLHNALHSPARP
jgi:hypothetical protein